MRVRSARFLGGTRAMASVASFYFAMFKRFLAICGGAQQGHANPDSAPANQLYGGFSLQSTQDAQGIFKKLGPQADVLSAAVARPAAAQSQQQRPAAESAVADAQRLAGAGRDVRRVGGGERPDLARHAAAADRRVPDLGGRQCIVAAADRCVRRLDHGRQDRRFAAGRALQLRQPQHGAGGALAAQEPGVHVGPVRSQHARRQRPAARRRRPAQPAGRCRCRPISGRPRRSRSPTRRACRDRRRARSPIR